MPICILKSIQTNPIRLKLDVDGNTLLLQFDSIQDIKDYARDHGDWNHDRKIGLFLRRIEASNPDFNNLAAVVNRTFSISDAPGGIADTTAEGIA